MFDDDALRRRFAQQRDADRERAPHFAHVLGRARVPARIRPLVLTAATAVVVATVWLATDRGVQPLASAPAITDWRAPTDALLRTPGNELLGAMPALGASLLDTMIPAPYAKGA